MTLRESSAITAINYYSYRLLQLSTDIRDTDESQHEAELICYPGFKCLAYSGGVRLDTIAPLKHFAELLSPTFRRFTEPDF